MSWRDYLTIAYLLLSPPAAGCVIGWAVGICLDWRDEYRDDRAARRDGG